jgi:D-beta-D-heptose 7-phosphate kinase/D-beta-D-heptose 1-phosphate adenosyltransferase
LNVLVIGDGCIDEYRYGNIRRVNPESTAPLLTYDHCIEKLGMAYNVAANLKSFGVETSIKVPANLSRKIRYVDIRTQDHLLRIDHDVRANPYRVESNYAYDAIVISDYNKGFITDDVILQLRKVYNGPIYMDTKKTNLKDFSGIYVKINEREMLESVSLPDRSMLIVTYGSKGAKYLDKIYPVPTIEVVDVCGAGDVFLAALVAKHLETANMETAIKFANEKAAKSCTFMGTVCVS